MKTYLYNLLLSDTYPRWALPDGRLHRVVLRDWTLGLRPFPRLVLVVRVLLDVEEAEPLSLGNVRPTVVVRQLLPLLTQCLGYLRIVYVGLHLDDLLPLHVGEDHEGVHRPLDVVGRVLLCLKCREEFLSNLLSV